MSHESKQAFTENLKFKKRDYHFQAEVVAQGSSPNFPNMSEFTKKWLKLDYLMTYLETSNQTAQRDCCNLSTTKYHWLEISATVGLFYLC